MVWKGGKGELGPVVKVPVFLWGAEWEVWADKTDGHEKWTLPGLGRPQPLYGLGRNSSIRIVFIARVCCFKCGTSRERANLVELLVGEVGFLPGELSPSGAGGIEILDDLVVEMRDTEGFWVSLIPVADMKNFTHRFRVVAMFGKELGHGDGLWHGTSQLMAEPIESGCCGMGSQHQGKSRWSANGLITVSEVESQASRG